MGVRTCAGVHTAREYIQRGSTYSAGVHRAQELVHRAREYIQRARVWTCVLPYVCAAIEPLQYCQASRRQAIGRAPVRIPEATCNAALLIVHVLDSASWLARPGFQFNWRILRSRWAAWAAGLSYVHAYHHLQQLQPIPVPAAGEKERRRVFVSGRRVYVCTYGIWSACVCKLKEARQAASASRVDAGDVAYRPHERTFVANRARHDARVDHSLPTRYVRPHCPQVTAAFHLRALGASAGPAAAGHCCCWLSCAVDVCMHGEPGSCLRCGRRARACRGAYVAGAAHVHETFRPWPRART